MKAASATFRTQQVLLVWIDIDIDLYIYINIYIQVYIRYIRQICIRYIYIYIQMIQIYRHNHRHRHMHKIEMAQDFFFLIFKIYLFIYLFLAVLGLRFCEGFLQLRQAGAALHRGVRASHYRGLSCCGAQAPDAQAQQLWLTGLVAPRHVGSSQTRAGTRVPCIGRQTLNHCATREAPWPRILIEILLHFFPSLFYHNSSQFQISTLYKLRI